MASNTPDVKVKVIKRYGMLEHPTIQFIVTKWYAYVTLHKVSLCDCHIFKDDFSGGVRSTHCESGIGVFVSDVGEDRINFDLRGGIA